LQLSITHPDGREEVLYKPLPHQLEFHAASCPNVLMSGGRGTGKSLAIRFDAHMRCLQFPGFRALILRREMPELRKTHLAYIEREMKLLGGKFNKTESIAYYPNGSTLVFGHCETEADILNYLSSEFGAIYFDELSTFTLDQFIKISASARAPEEAPYVAVVRAGTNPLGEGAGWIRQWFIDKSVDLEQFSGYHPDDFRNIHSTVDDNPHIDREAYKKRLSALPEHVRRAWLHGEWIDQDGYFADFRHRITSDDGESRPWHVIEDLPTVKGRPLLDQPWISIYRAVDWGFSPDPAVCLWIAVLPNGRAIVFKEKTWLKTTAMDVAKDIVRESEGMRIVETTADPSIWANSGHTGLAVADYFEQNGVPLTPSRNDRAAAGYAIHEWLNALVDEEPKLQIHRSAVNLIRTLPEMRIDKHDASKIAAGNDHWVIALAYFCQGHIAPSREPSISVVPRWMHPKKTTRRVLGAANVRSRIAA
jgi:phage terminase large subunit